MEHGNGNEKINLQSLSFPDWSCRRANRGNGKHRGQDAAVGAGAEVWGWVGWREGHSD